MASEPELIEFSPTDPAAAVARMRTLAERHQGWVNLHPIVEEDELPKNSIGFFAWVAAKGPEIPQATWVAGQVRRRGLEPDSIGLQHPGGQKARIRLGELGLPIPEGWRLRADHPRRGLVVELPEGTDPGTAVAWLLPAAMALSSIRLPERWVAAVYEG